MFGVGKALKKVGQGLGDFADWRERGGLKQYTPWGQEGQDLGQWGISKLFGQPQTEPKPTQFGPTGIGPNGEQAQGLNPMPPRNPFMNRRAQPFAGRMQMRAPQLQRQPPPQGMPRSGPNGPATPPPQGGQGGIRPMPFMRPQPPPGGPQAFSQGPQPFNPFMPRG